MTELPAMGRNAVWTGIAAILAAEISGGRYRPGDRLPSEADLSARFGVNRHTVRRALAHLAGAGEVFARRGAGVFVSAAPRADYPLGRRVRFRQNIAATGRVPSRRITHVETRRADATEAAALGLADGGTVHVIEGVSLADDMPIAAFRSVVPALRFPGFPAAMQRTGSITAAFAEAGVADYTRVSTRLVAKTAGGTLALRLRLTEGAPVLRATGVNADAQGRPVEFGTTWFAGERVALTVTPD
ncbi:MAG: phosphonate metabolism transcriptional regulator PhnF [Paracoccaceae bacterium]